MRLVDLVVRQGHLSERAIADAVTTGERPAHLDICSACDERAQALGRWLDSVAANASAMIDEEFPVERLAAQQSQILRRLEQADEPPRVIAFPHQGRLPHREAPARRIAPAWLGVSAAAGLVIGLIGGQFTGTASVSRASLPTETINASAPAVEPERLPTRMDAGWIDLDLEYATPTPLHYLDEATPTPLPIGTLAVAQTGS